VTTTATRLHCAGTTGFTQSGWGFVPVPCHTERGLRSYQTKAGPVAYCARHEAEVRRQYAEVEPVWPGDVAESADPVTAAKGWTEHTHFDDRDATLRDCPACDELVDKYA
jgi:hypothetical protein